MLSFVRRIGLRIATKLVGLKKEKKLNQMVLNSVGSTHQMFLKIVGTTTLYQC